MSDMKRSLKSLLIMAAAVGLACGCGSEEDEADEDEGCTVPLDSSYNPAIDPQNFVATVNNQYFPLPVGKTWTYQEGAAQVVVTVTSDTKAILGVTCTVVRDTVTLSGQVVEDTWD